MLLDDVLPVVSVRTVSHPAVLTRTEILHHFRVSLGNVLLHVRLELVIGSTVWTLVQLYSPVAAIHVAIVGGFVHERHRALLTSVQLFPDLLVDRLDVHKQRRCTGIRFRAQFTLEGTLAAVFDADVLLQQLIQTEGFVTFVAFELVLRLMHFKVH